MLMCGLPLLGPFAVITPSPTSHSSRVATALKSQLLTESLSSKNHLFSLHPTLCIHKSVMSLSDFSTFLFLTNPSKYLAQFIVKGAFYKYDTARNYLLIATSENKVNRLFVTIDIVRKGKYMILPPLALPQIGQTCFRVFVFVFMYLSFYLCICNIWFFYLQIIISDPAWSLFYQKYVYLCTPSMLAPSLLWLLWLFWRNRNIWSYLPLALPQIGPNISSSMKADFPEFLKIYENCFCTKNDKRLRGGA